ncbi:substrate-binding domain-containing protein [Rhodococcus pyridinivorans]|uniref:substrate-binding domain-containing protein n=1 Tax=Rhodococcus pyridinivorans TaxID=103816 RepID=UPI0039B4B84A
MFSTTRRRSARGQKRGTALAALFLLFLVPACSSVGTGGGSAGETDTAAVAAAEERLAPLVVPVEETRIEVDAPLTSRPPAGKRVDVIRYNNSAAALYDQPMKEAGAALSWDVNIAAVDATDPQSIPNAMIRAVSQNADYIVVTSSDLQAAGVGMEAAKKAGIPVFFGAGVGEPQGEVNGLYGNTQSESLRDAIFGLTDKMIIESGGNGSALLVNAPDFPQLAPLGDQTKEYVAEHCSGCSLDVLNIPASDLGGDVASSIVAKVRQNPAIKYVIISFATLSIGLAPALQAAGLDDVTVYLSGAEAAEVELIRNGTYAAGSLYPINNYPWLLFDQIARFSVGMDTLQKEHAALGMQIWTTESVPDGATSWDPPNYQEQYKKLWQVS